MLELRSTDLDRGDRTWARTSPFSQAHKMAAGRSCSSPPGWPANTPLPCILIEHRLRRRPLRPLEQPP